ncbi:sulfatase-like hydrolase/transferase [Flavitalea sp. BT771]|uniref:sulfatase-like hydrolase/transferase n=1 Tax=Flavitalea sp. BT771 TaxID=3063329 RepID=UPI0026E1BD77|nr:sulfatase-like hydrolase/transferase [Flavitalea sp. BT771]MDO6431336.1 sulfatase-like hydrolase/transferase [Flavitalea sp. BT771]MDV6220244.1 sulfatase-like hydrolase/transferase [Flavitalea sp. BT771]
MKMKLRYIPLFPFLLPVFFVLHGFIENRPFISLRDCGGLVLTYLLIAGGLYILLYLFYRNAAKASLALGTLQAVSFFFGAMHDFLTRHAGFLSRYSVILPVLTILIATALVWLKKTSRKLSGLVLFLNVLLLIYLLVDGASAFFTGDQNQERLTLATPIKQAGPACDTCTYPDVYLLLMDEYASTASLKEWFHYDNSALDSFLRERGFHIQQGSRSNYNFTSFSMASILNMSYLEGLEPGNVATIAGYASSKDLIRSCEVVKQFAAHGYDIVNYSVFDLEGKPSEVNLHLLPAKASLITGQTLWSRIVHDIGWNLHGLPLRAIRDQVYQILHDNDHLIEEAEKQSAMRSARPRFVYVHLLLPHNPFYYDSHGSLNEPGNLRQNIEGYLDYLPYTNEVIKKLVTSIQQNTHNNAVIIMMGDHGVRYPAPGDTLNIHDHQNQNAIFFPGRDYHLLYDSISGVNQFRVVFNSLFRQNIPLLKDSTVYLTDKKL